MKIGVSRTTGSLATCSDIHLATCSFSAFSRRQYSAEYSDDDDDVTASVAGVEVCEVDALLGAAVGFVAAKEACGFDEVNLLHCFVIRCFSLSCLISKSYLIWEYYSSK